ncbi:hypothetical protein F2Q69_00042216 [Brassica cretica]|uniref:Uncharacterized protein n=1 Tax=Brassica cretica TaxID=69181 RepID=A0A8S9NPU5_BRACR|nr:hypothetical protein F2Q69_00042216 [Brassica cretica]
MHGQAHICLLEHAEKFSRTLPKLYTYSRADIDDMVHEIYRAKEMSQEESYRRLDDVYYPLNDSIERLTIHMDALKEEMDVIRRHNAVRTEAESTGDRQSTPVINRQSTPFIDRRAPLCYREISAGDIRELSEDSPEPMQVDQATVGRTLRKRKKKVPKHLKRGVNDKEMDSFTKRILMIPMDNPFEEDTLPTSCGCSS